MHAQIKSRGERAERTKIKMKRAKENAVSTAQWEPSLPEEQPSCRRFLFLPQKPAPEWKQKKK